MRHLSAVWLSISLGILLGVSAAAHAATGAKLNWTIPTTRENGQALAISELTGYELYYTTDNPAVTGTIKVGGGSTSSYTVQNLAAGTYHFAMSAIDANGVKSKLSTVANVTLAASTALLSAPSSMTVATLLTSTATGFKNIKVSWIPPKTRLDGTQLLASEVSGYTIELIIPTSGASVISTTVNGGSVNSYGMSNIKTGKYILALAAIDNSGRIGAYVSRVISVQ